jgi:hypothetical protein
MRGHPRGGRGIREMRPRRRNNAVSLPPPTIGLVPIASAFVVRSSSPPLVASVAWGRGWARDRGGFSLSHDFTRQSSIAPPSALCSIATNARIARRFRLPRLQAAYASGERTRFGCSLPRSTIDAMSIKTAACKFRDERLAQSRNLALVPGGMPYCCFSRSVLVPVCLPCD